MHPQLTTSSSGGPPIRPHGTSSGGSRRRESGARERKRPAPGDAVVGSSAQVGASLACATAGVLSTAPDESGARPAPLLSFTRPRLRDAQVARPSMGVHRSKRPKVPAQPRAVGDGTLGSKAKPVLKVITELLRHPMAPPFAAPVDPSRYPDYYNKVSSTLSFIGRTGSTPACVAMRPLLPAAPHRGMCARSSASTSLL